MKTRKIQFIFYFLLFMFNSMVSCILASNGNDGSNQSSVQYYQFPRISPASEHLKVKVNGKEVLAYRTSAGSFVTFGCKGEFVLEIEAKKSIGNYRVLPSRLGIQPNIEKNKFSVKCMGPVNFLVELNGIEHLYVYANAIDTSSFNEKESGTTIYRQGQVYEIGEKILKSNESVYIEGGAVVRGCFKAHDAKNVKIGGYGVIDGSYFVNDNKSYRTILFELCKKSIIENVILIEPTGWMIKLHNSDSILVNQVKELGFISTSDGVDIVGSSNVRVSNCFFRNGDDCVVIKSMPLYISKKDSIISPSRNVENVIVTGCSLMANKGGQAMEIGHELNTDKINNIQFVNCDVLGVHDLGGVFGIHNSDRAVISNVLYENIRVDHYYNKLIDLRIIQSRYFTDEKRGSANNIVFRNIYVTVSKYNPGYSTSLIGGFDKDHKIKNVTFDNFRLNDIKVTNADQLDLFLKQTENVVFK